VSEESRPDLQLDDAQKFLIFQIGDELFASPLVEIREVIEFQQAKPIPHMPTFFKGVINIRGEIVGVIDLRQRLGVIGNDAARCQLVFETEAGPLAAIVDRVHSVSIIEESQLDRRSTIGVHSTDRSYFLGVGKFEDRIFTLISLRKLLKKDELPPAE
jgi:purine-binding chemotaxis protein CheW